MIPVFNVNDIVTWALRAVEFALKFGFVAFLFKVITGVFNFLIKPVGLLAVVGLINAYPDLLRSILYYIGLYTVKISVGFYKMFSTVLMSRDALSNFGAGSGSGSAYDNVREMYELARAGLPAEWVQLIQTLDLVPLIGLVIATTLYVVGINIVYSMLYKNAVMTNIKLL